MDVEAKLTKTGITSQEHLLKWTMNLVLWKFDGNLIKDLVIPLKAPEQATFSGNRMVNVHSSVNASEVYKVKLYFFLEWSM